MVLKVADEVVFCVAVLGVGLGVAAVVVPVVGVVPAARFGFVSVRKVPCVSCSWRNFHVLFPPSVAVGSLAGVFDMPSIANDSVRTY